MRQDIFGVIVMQLSQWRVATVCESEAVSFSRNVYGSPSGEGPVSVRWDELCLKFAERVWSATYALIVATNKTRVVFYHNDFLDRIGPKPAYSNITFSNRINRV